MIDWQNIVFPAAGIIVSSCLAVWQAKKTAKAEIEKLKMIWAHEKETAHDADFDKMVAAVSLYEKYPHPKNFQDASNAVAVYRAKVTGDMADAVDALSRMIVRDSPNCSAVSNQLSAIVTLKREKSA